MHIFGYGSLISESSVSRTLSREVMARDLVPATLHGYQRDWGIAIPVVFDDGGVELAAFLDVQPAPGALVNGVLIAVTGTELATVARREAQYDVIDVTEHIQTSAALNGRVFTARGRPEHRCEATENRIVVPTRYRSLVMEAVTARSEAFAEEFWSLTAPSPWAERDGGYRFHDPDQEAAARPQRS